MISVSAGARDHLQIFRMRRQQRAAARRALVRSLGGLPHAPPDGLPIEPEPAGQFRDRHLLIHGQTAQLFPSLTTKRTGHSSGMC